MFVLYLFTSIVLLLSGIYINSTSSNSLHFPTTPETVQIQTTKETAQVKRVIDGDTIVLSNNQKVRYIGIDTPEIKSAQCFATEAAEFNRKLVEGKQVILKKDISQTDRYGRLLRYVWVGDTFVNEYLVSEGYARQSTFPPDVFYAKLFQEAAQTARIKNKGLWNGCK